MAKEIRNFAAAPTEGEMDLTKAQVENVAEPIQGSPEPQSPDDTAASDEEAPIVVNGEQVQANTEATDGGDAAAPTAIESDEATTDTTESNDAIQEEQAQFRAADRQRQNKLRKTMEEKKMIQDENFTCKLSDLIKMGYILATFVFNREIDEKHAKALLKDVRSQGKKCFSQDISACLAISALLMGYKAVDMNGNPVTLDSPNLEKTLIITDGQHRATVCLGTNLDIDCNVMITPCPENIVQDIIDKNKIDKNWGSTSFREQIVKTTGKTDLLADYEKKAAEIYPGTTDKFRDLVLTGKNDAVRRANVSKGILPECDTRKAEMGLEVLKGLRLFNPDTSKNASMTLAMPKSIFSKMGELAVNDMTNDQFVKIFKLFAAKNEKACDTKEKAEEFIENFSEKFDEYLKEHGTSILPEELDAFEKKIKKIVDAGPAKIVKSKSGSFTEMIQRLKEFESAAAEKASKKSENAKKAADKAKKSADEVAKGAKDGSEAEAKGTEEGISNEADKK